MFEKRRKPNTIVCYVGLFANDQNVVFLFCILLDNLLTGLLLEDFLMSVVEIPYMSEIATIPSPTITIFWRWT